MTPNAFRKIALAFPEAVEEPHFEKTSFRVRKKIFATLAPEKGEAVLKFTPLDQSIFCESGGPGVNPVPGRWGEQGWTAVELSGVEAAFVKDLLARAYCTVAPARLAAMVDP